MVVERSCRIPHSDLDIVRVTCKQCNRTLETTVDETSKVLYSGRCPFCNKQIFAPHNPGQEPFSLLYSAFQRLKELQPQISVEFVIPDPEGKTA